MNKDVLRITTDPDEAYYGTLTEEDFSNWLDEFWRSPRLAGGKMKFEIISAKNMQMRRWYAVNYMWIYKKGKTGRISKRPHPLQSVFRMWLAMKPITFEEIGAKNFDAVIIDEPIKP